MAYPLHRYNTRSKSNRNLFIPRQKNMQLPHAGTKYQSKSKTVNHIKVLQNSSSDFFFPSKVKNAFIYCYFYQYYAIYLNIISPEFMFLFSLPLWPLTHIFTVKSVIMLQKPFLLTPMGCNPAPFHLFLHFMSNRNYFFMVNKNLWTFKPSKQ